jgi:membrane protease subunit HflK
MSFEQRPPDINYEMQKLIEQLQKFKGTFSSFFLIGIFVIAGLSSYYTVEPDEEAVLIRFGRYIKTTQPGLHFKMPFGIEKVTKVKTKIVHQEEFGFRTTNTSTRRTTYSSRNFESESLMLTGDLNVAEVQWVVQYQISDPFKFLFQTSESVRNIRDVSESIIRRVVGDKLVTDVLTTGRVEIASTAKILMQEVLDRYDMGVNIKSIKLQDVNPPKTVQDSFNEVNSAKQEQEKMVNQAEESYNKVIPEARGKAEKLVAEAEAFAEASINRAYGDAQRFNAQYKEYRKAPAITRKRIYLKTMQELYSKLDSITIIDPKVKGLLPIYNGSSNSTIKGQ